MPISPEQARENGRKGGRPKGSRGAAARDVQRFVDAVFARIDPEKFAVELMEKCKSEKVQGMVFLRLLEYRYGRPVQQLEADVNLTMNSEIVETLKAARKRWSEK